MMTPLLIFVFGLPAAVAVGTDLVYAALTKSAGVAVHGFRGTIRWDIVGLLAAGSLPGTVITLAVLRSIDVHGSTFSHLVSLLLGAMLVLTSVVLFAKRRWQRWVDRTRPPDEDRRCALCRSAATVVAGFLIGVLVTLTSIGAGALGAAILFLIYPRLPAISVVGTDLAHAVPLALVAGVGHIELGTVEFTVLGALLLGSLPGIYIGSHLGLRLPERVMRPILASLLLVLGLRLVA